MIPKVFNATFGRIFKNSTVVKRIGKSMSTKALEVTTKKAPNVIVKLIKGAFSKMSKSFIGKIAAKIAKKFVAIASGVGVIIEVAMLLKAFIDGLSGTKRIFNLGTGVSPSIAMSATAAIGAVISELLFGIISSKAIAQALYSFIGGAAEKEGQAAFKEFLEKKAKILRVKSGPLQEYDSKNLWQSAWNMLGGGDKKDANLLGFKDVGEYKRWRDKLYKPVQDLHKSLAEEYGGRRVVEALVPKNGDEAENQRKYREEILAKAQELANQFFGEAVDEEDTKKQEDIDEQQKDELEKVQDDPETPKNSPAMAAAAAGAVAGAAGAAAVATGGAASGGSVTGDDVKTKPEGADKTATTPSTPTSAAGEVAATLANSSTSATAAKVAMAGGAAVAGGVLTGAAIASKQPMAPRAQHAFLPPSNSKDSDADPLTVLTNSIGELRSEIETLNLIYDEQTRHNRVTERALNLMIRQNMLVIKGQDANASVTTKAVNKGKSIVGKALDVFGIKNDFNDRENEIKSIGKEVAADAAKGDWNKGLTDADEKKGASTNVNDYTKISTAVTDFEKADKNANAGGAAIIVANTQTPAQQPGMTPTESNMAKTTQG